MLEAAGYRVQVRLSQPGFIRAMVEADDREATRIEWAHDSAWRFMPLVRLDDGGLVLHDVDLAINKVLTLAGRDEPRDFVDILHAHEHILPWVPWSGQPSRRTRDSTRLRFSSS